MKEEKQEEYDMYKTRVQQDFIANKECRTRL
jgi:hypothetical protein